MVTSDSDRGPASTPTYERPTPTSQPETREPVSVSVRNPLWFLSLVVSGATMASLWGLSTVVLSILGLAGVQPTYMLPVDGIVLGTAFLTLGTVGIVWGRMFRFPTREISRGRFLFSSGVMAVLIAGIAAVVLNVLYFVFPGDMRLAAAAVIVLGLGFLWHSGGMRRVSRFAHDVTYEGVPEYRPTGPFAINALTLAPVRDFFVGLGGIVLGILAMLHIAPLALAFVALLTMGGALAFSASTICGATMASLKGVYGKS